ncbi:uncharacterized protein [Tursiops truncatus]|uniref:uncharacterized protein isoform X3 n=1 Tax=Tursiops truncatus TaxID=9739 RepID=UPI003CCF01EB
MGPGGPQPRHRSREISTGGSAAGAWQQAEAAWSLAVQEEGVQPKRMSGRQTVPRRHGSKSKYRSRCLAAARGCQPRELAWEEVPVGVVIARISCRWRPSRRTEWKVGLWMRIGARDLRGQKGRKDSNGGEDPDAPDTSQATSGSYRDPHKGPHAQNPSFGFKNSEELLHWPIPSGSDLEHVRGEAWPFTAYEGPLHLNVYRKDC